MTNTLDKIKPAVSVIIPIYNVEQYLRQCMDSVITQTLINIEIICINDGSLDNCLEILREYEKRDSRIVVISRENRGAGFSRNEGLNIANGEFVIFMDPDDWYPSENSLLELYTNAKLNNALVCGGSLSAYKNGETQYLEYPYAFANEGFIEYGKYQYPFFYQRFLFNRNMLTENDICFPEYKRFQDAPFMIKAMIASGKFYAIKSSVYTYRVDNKAVNFSDDTIVDVLKGYIECLNISKENNLINLHMFIANLLITNHYPVVKNLHSSNLKVHSMFIETLLAMESGMLGIDSVPLCLYNFFLNDVNYEIESSSAMDLASMDALLKWLRYMEHKMHGTPPFDQRVPRFKAYKSIFTAYKNILMSKNIYDPVKDNFMELAKKHHIHSL
ncbi:MAG: glycosyltransferase [Acidobacteriota bacterium]|jgi:glycosyltransferase involved in cell wall biosynthesis|nr:glycosyltransferase [Acidobacteriota bacterium]